VADPFPRLIVRWMEAVLSPLHPLGPSTIMAGIQKVMRLVEADTDIVCNGCLSLYL
jgi:hypothetical protein